MVHNVWIFYPSQNHIWIIAAQTSKLEGDYKKLVTLKCPCLHPGFLEGPKVMSHAAGQYQLFILFLIFNSFSDADFKHLALIEVVLCVVIILAVIF